ncbi:MAG: universal stress protein, partial [Deltaproteobacteria bacterium]|nr:universal stress protein [Deltaproteobacteria bacterium]
SDLEHVMLGSVAEKIIRHSPVPVLSYRTKGS